MLVYHRFPICVDPLGFTQDYTSTRYF
jgi:hypothetical protein